MSITHYVYVCIHICIYTHRYVYYVTSYHIISYANTPSPPAAAPSPPRCAATTAGCAPLLEQSLRQSSILTLHPTNIA